jgi:hypothetical protein
LSAFSPTHWVIAAVIAAAILYGIVGAIRACLRLRAWMKSRP